jgi:transglutaminase-like putative cysteine protease
MTTIMRRIQIKHTTRYRYQEEVILLPHTLHLRPREGHDIRLESSRLEITPDFEIRWQRDVYGNSVAVVNFLKAARKLAITSEVVVEHYEDQPLDFVLADIAQLYPFRYDPMEQVDLTPYQLCLFPQDQPELHKWLAEVCKPGQLIDTIELLTNINNKIVHELEYKVREDPGVQTPATTLVKGNGSCRDFATLFIECCRHCGFASRFVSGYLLNDAAAEQTHAASTHAWSEIYLPGSGWRGFDSTSGLVVGGDHIAAAVHRHPEAVPPIAGSFLGSPNAKPKLEVELHVERL